jgi:signal transduction histidine kinase
LRRREAGLALAVAAVLVMALLTVFAIELSNTQAKSTQDVKARVHERGVLAAALIDSLFQSVQQQIPEYARNYGTPTVSNVALDKQQAQSKEGGYLVLLGPSGNILASSSGFNTEARADLDRSASLHIVRSGRAYGLGNLRPYEGSGVIDYAVAFPTRFGTRTLIQGFTPSVLGSFLAADLKKIPGVRGAHNYLIDGNEVVLASTNPAVPVGRPFSNAGAVQALGHTSGEFDGQYFDTVRLDNSTWRIVLAAPNGPLFASVSGLHKWIPWVIFVAFALVALAALMLGRRVLRAAREVRDANAQLELLNSELGEANEALGRRAAELERSNSELEQFASIASHDLQEPLRKVRTFTQRATEMEQERLSEQGRDYLARANSAAERMQKLIEDLLKYSRVATHGRPFESVDLDALTHEVLIDLETQVERAGGIVEVSGLPAISGDALQLRQLIQNLISNGLKFRREGVAPEVRVLGTVQGDRLELTVRDNGIGFEPRYSRRIFRVFERLHGRNDYPGTGIGLALCRRIAERHGGTIAAEGFPGEGASFTVTLPINQRREVIAPASNYAADEQKHTTNTENEEAHVVV